MRPSWTQSPAMKEEAKLAEMHKMQTQQIPLFWSMSRIYSLNISSVTCTGRLGYVVTVVCP